MGSINPPLAQTRNDLCVNADSLSPSLVASALFLRIIMALADWKQQMSKPARILSFLLA
jgi:hypothetical protein